MHNTSCATWITPSLNCKHPLMCVHTSHWPYGYPSFTLCSWQWMRLNPWCNLQHLCCHCTRCWFPCGTRTITCTSFNHIQLLLLTHQHCVYQRWYSHLSRCFHCRPNANKLTSLLLCNSRIYYLHYTKMCFSSLWVSLDFEWIRTFYLLKLVNPLMNGDSLTS